ncbi:SDR family NAD(P)-dependent oxidoreductase [Rhodococcus sp. JVH1]|uniref:SDR family NAD(P)-dependent oxidoreductase n=1 Tax=Rhodococcus sp. JVH1 TaxID=745408 RepID=UPI0002720DF6|nr:SDR family oxidoreductase [Rhodococcus sp. JVH1]EJI96318.1 short chain dehydrogenase family protein [Rhodococcus sp. JVH1]
MTTDDARLRDTCALVTGAARGIGAATAELFHAHGATVYLGDVDDELGESVAAKIGARAHYRHLDVTDESQWTRVTTEMADRGHPMRVLVNSAGAASKAPIMQTSLADLRRMIDLNLVGTFLGLQAAGAAMTTGGSVVNLSSLRGVLATAELGAYGASKFGVRALTRVAALEFAESNIRVNAVCPGSIETAITAGADFGDDDMDAYVKSIPLQRRGLPLEVAKAILFLACEDSSYITGSDLMIDGGTSAGARTPKRPTQS